MDATFRSNAIRACTRWLQQEAAFSQDARIEFKVDPASGECKAVAKGGNIGIGTVILSVPYSKCLHPGHDCIEYSMKVIMEKVSALSEACGPMAQDDPTFEHNLAMTLLLMREMCRASLAPQEVSLWKAYIETLPREATTPVYNWTEEDLAHAANTELAPQAALWRRALDAAYAEVVEPLFRTHADEFQAHLFGEERRRQFFRTCAGLVWSRALPAPDSGAPLLMPLIDLFNGSPEGLHGAALVADEARDAIQVVTTAYIHEGCEILLSYGAISTCDFALRYGIADACVDGRNPYDSVQLDVACLFPLSAAFGDEALRAAKVALLSRMGLPLNAPESYARYGPYTVHRATAAADGSGNSGALLPLALRQLVAVLAVASRRDLATLAERGAVPAAAVPEGVAGAAALSVVDARLRAYATRSRRADLRLLLPPPPPRSAERGGGKDEDEDKGGALPPPLTANAAHAIRLRMAERELLLQLRREVCACFKLAEQAPAEWEPNQQLYCDGCGRDSTEVKLLLCGRCGEAAYCGAPCQRARHAVHKLRCAVRKDASHTHVAPPHSVSGDAIDDSEGVDRLPSPPLAVAGGGGGGGGGGSGALPPAAEAKQSGA